MDNQCWRGGAKEREQGERILNHENNPQARCAQHPAGTSKNSLCRVILTSLLTSERVCQRRESTGTYTQDQGFSTGPGCDPEHEDVHGQSCPEHAGISVITDVSARVLRTQQPLCTELGPSQMDKNKQERSHLLGTRIKLCLQGLPQLTSQTTGTRAHMGFPLDTATEEPQAVSKVARMSSDDSMLGTP